MASEVTVTSVKIGDVWVTVAFRDGTILANSIPSEKCESSRSSVIASLKERGIGIDRIKEEETDEGRKLAAIVEGSVRKPPRPTIISLDGLTAFQKVVLERVMEIPAGKVSTYKDVASAVGRPRAYRAVGNIMANNPFPYLVPCHRVVKSDLSIGGYGPSPEMKARFLKGEGVDMDKGKVKARHRLALDT